MPPLVFLSYRRSDAQQAALGLFAQLRSRLGPNSVFMDRSGISPGTVWPVRLREQCENATVVLALMGSNWLTAADKYGRRRLDIPADWVRTELATGLEAGKPVIPVLLPPLVAMHPEEALPNELSALVGRQVYTLREDHWDSDINELVRLLTKNYGFKEIDRPVRLPSPELTIEPLSPTQLHEALRSMSGWEPVESLQPGDYPNTREELRKVYVFKSFSDAIAFMSSAVDIINRVPHHPRWENQWRTVTVYLCTWDIGSRISKLDVDLANELDTLHARLSRP